MGQKQPLPLPERIPLPDNKNLEIELLFTGIQIIIDETEEEELTTIHKPKYVRYKLPDKWNIVDASIRSDIPRFYIIDVDQNIRVTMTGEWKGYPSDKVKIYAINNGPYFSKYSKEEIRFGD